MTYHLSMSARLPHFDALILQICTFFAIELAFQNCILRFIVIAPKTTASYPAPNNSETKLLIQHSHHEEAENLVLDFVRPRGTLLAAVGLLGTPTGLSRYTGRLHPMAMVLWIVLEQLVNCGSLERSGQDPEKIVEG